MEFPIVYKAVVDRKTKLIIFILILGVALTALGFMMKMDQPDVEGSGTIAYVGYFFLGMAILLFLLGNLRAKQEADTTYIVDRDCFIWSRKNNEERFYYRDNIFSGKIQRTNGNKFLILTMEDRNGKKNKRTMELYENDFRTLLDNISDASSSFLNGQGV